MKRIKKFAALLLALAIMLAFVGCGKMTAEKLAVKMAAALVKTPITSESMNMEMEMSIGVQGMTLDMNMDMAMDMLMCQDPYQGYMDMEISMDVLGQSVNQSMQVYMLSEGDVITTYSHMDTGDLWQKATMEVSAGELAKQSGNYDWLKEKPVEALTLAEETQTIAGHEVYVLSCTITGEEMQKMMNSMGSTFEDMGVSEFDVSALEVPTIFYADTKTFLPVQMEMEIQGMDEMMAGMMQEMLGGELSSLGMEMEIGTVCIVMTDIGYDAVQIPAVPQAGLDAEEAA